jgi:c(7)-type cytochrome triheme protein
MNKLLGIAVLLFCLLIPVTVLAEKVGGGDLTFNPKGAAPVIFSHEKHVSEKGLKCSGCHYQIFQMAQGSYKLDMKKMTKGDFCGRCHNGQKAFDVSEQKNCVKCHR